MENYCLLNTINKKVIDYKTATLVSKRLKNTGQSSSITFPDSTPNGMFSGSFSILPILQYHENINGGNAAKPFVIGNLTLSGDKAFYQTSGLVGGLGVKFAGRSIYGQGKYLNYSMYKDFALHPSSSDKILNTIAEICSKNLIGQSLYLDACTSNFISSRELTHTDNTDISFVGSHTFTNNKNTHSLAKLGVNRLFTNEYVQNQIILGVETLHSHRVFTEIETIIGEVIQNKLATRTSILGTLSFNVAGKPLRLNTSLSQATGGLILGFANDNQRISVSASYPIWRNITAVLGYTEINSTIDYFDSSLPTLGLEFSPIHF